MPLDFPLCRNTVFAAQHFCRSFLVQYSPHLTTAHINLARIRENYRILRHAAVPSSAASMPEVSMPRPDAGGSRGESFAFSWPELMPVIKADAYGHGHIRIARVLMKEGAKLFASGSIQESAELRAGLSSDAGNAEGPAVLSLLGITAPEDILLASTSGVISVIHCFRQLDMLSHSLTPLTVALKCNTGMYRLGFEEEELPLLLAKLATMPHVKPVLALSHMASADTELGKQAARVQASVFKGMLGSIRAQYPNIAVSLGNSAGTLLAREITDIIGPHICRPGIALYGANPFAGTSLEPLGAELSPAMSVSAPVIAVRDLPTGCGIGYGHTFRATKNMRVAIIAAGYADAYPRSMSGKGVICVRGVRAPVLGRVSMQMTAVDVSACPEAKPGDEAWILGGPYDEAVSVAELAWLWGSISYEVFCLLGMGTRVYED